MLWRAIQNSLMAVQTLFLIPVKTFFIVKSIPSMAPAGRKVKGPARTPTP